MNEDKEDIVFRYYEDQWQQVRHHENMRSSMTFQILAVAGGLIAAFTQSSESFIQIGVSIGIIVLGILGLIIFLKTHVVMQIHVSRAREARKSLCYLEAFAKFRDPKLPKFPNLHVYYSFLYVFIIFIGIVFLMSAI